MSDYAVFVLPEFDPNDYANAILAGEPYPPQAGKTKPVKNPGLAPASEDVSVAISKLTFNLDDVEKQLKNVVTTHHESLLVQAAGVSGLESSLGSVRTGLNELDSSLEKLRVKIRMPYQSLQKHVTKLDQIQQASNILRRTSRFVILVRRLEVQLAEMNKTDTSAAIESAKSNSASTSAGTSAGRAETPLAENEDEKERAIAKAALTIAELTTLLNPPAVGEASADEQSAGDHIPLSSIKAVAAHLPFVDAAHARITSDMEAMVLTGLGTLNQSLLASSLQTAHNLRVLPDLVQNLVSDLSQAVEDRIRTALDLTRISKDIIAKETNSIGQGLLYKSRVRTEPTSVTAPQWTAALWGSLESLIEEMSDCCVKVYTLEKVLRIKRDPVTDVVFLDEAMKVLENRPSTTFWSSLGRSLEKHARDAAKSSTFLQQTLSTNYPRLLRLFHSFFTKIAVHTDTVYSQTQQSPETILVLRALSNFESLYLSRSSNRLNEAVGQAFSGGSRAPPGTSEGINIARAVANELDSAKFDPILVQSVARYAVSSLELMFTRLDSLIARERAATSLVGPVATAQQVLNSSLATCVYHTWARLDKLREEYPDKVVSILQPVLDKLHDTFDKIVDPLLASIRRELAAIIAKLHRMDFAASTDPMSAMGGGASPYMKDLVEKLAFIKDEILAQYHVPEVSRQWVLATVRFVIQTFVLHASIAKPLGESGKLQLTTDMTELEFALSAFMSDKTQSGRRGADWESVGEDYRALRAMRQLLFLDNAALASPNATVGLPPLIVLHHILVRSPITLPHELHGWAEAEYVRWVEEHSEEEAWTLVDGDVTHWEKITETEGGDVSLAAEYVQLARTVLSNAQKSTSS
ncbi:Golgi transport complex subunit 5-domain-containing protein [Dichomitus squalens]|uniref:Conserved oligomeric Golgi complex subunit 5 n=1 Tax=Dichomitus squalens TaxID=114155 RepID=A0A4Q9QAN0_9APHY|nr:Golgi transport complex subunit 5-domain-containing protein [Dichomitus squalens]TBU64320.1 Golgi transport complex subunit 5-domain-containing protein [Dichomitus squalens]